MTAEWRDRYRAVVASERSARDGMGWEFITADGRPVWAVFREDSGAFPVFSSGRGDALPPAQADLLAMTERAVADLLAAAGLADDVGWITQNLAAALSWAGHGVLDWEGEERALESGPADEPLAWASPTDGRIPFSWLRALTSDGPLGVGSYQDDGVFGLDFTDPGLRQLPDEDVSSLRSRRSIPLARGTVRAVEVVYDTAVEGGQCAGLVTEALLHTSTQPLLLMAAEAYGVDGWRLYDESVVAVPDSTRLGAMSWIPQRQSWRSTESGLWV